MRSGALHVAIPCDLHACMLIEGTGIREVRRGLGTADRINMQWAIFRGRSFL